MTTCKKQRKESGFTLIELSMSLLFIAFIMLLLISTLFSMMRTYNKGVWMSQINQAGRQIMADMSESMRFSSRAAVIPAGAQRFCAGGVSYIWNVGNSGGASSSFKNMFGTEPANAITNKTSTLRLVRIADSTGSYCTTNLTTMPSKTDGSVTNMLSSGAIIQKFQVSVNPLGNLLKIDVVISTEGDVQPQQVNAAGAPDPNGTWKCGDVVNGHFTPSGNQYCAFIELNTIVFRRSL